MRGFQVMEGTGLDSQETGTEKLKVGRWEACGCSEKGELFGLVREQE